MSLNMQSRERGACLVTLLAALVPAGGCDVSDADPSDGTTEVTGAVTDGPSRCPSLTVRRTGSNSLGQTPVTVSTTAVPGPLVARIINNGLQISCGPSAPSNLLVHTTPWERRIAGAVIRATPKGNVLSLSPPLPYQATPQGPMSIAGFIFYPGDLRLEGSGWPSRTLGSLTEFDWAQEGPYFYARGRLYAKMPLTLVQSRPADLVATSGDRFIYRCELQGTARWNACSSLCSSRCTANPGYPLDPTGINRCISDCTNTCASDTGCPPIFCTGSDCPSGCPAANVCTSTAQCTAGKTCNAGCCITIIH